MKNTILITLILLIGILNLFSQSGTTRAVVVGISNYQDKAIPNLRFADKDAQAFVQYLQSSAGGSLPDENIKLLTNEKATMAAVAAELDWLVEVSQEGDQAIIYFSGHGDVEAKTARQPGFLLTYDSPPKIYIAGAYPLFYLQLIIETLSSDKNVQTLVITDACRAGKLAGSAIGGTQATAANLAKQYANEIKILSCQPDEFSLEGEQWGGGRGAFSYHLIEGLLGLADKNDNLQVNLLELENYLETVVPEETAPQTQIPMTIGSKGSKIAYVDEGTLAKLKDLKSKQLPTLDAIESRGIEESLLANVDSTIQIKYDAFIAALDNKILLDAKNGQPSANELYQQLIEEKSLATLHRFMTRQFATALQDDAQQAINAYLSANPTELSKHWEGDTTYSNYPRFLGRAAELLGEDHYMHDYLIAKQLYFEGLNLRLQADKTDVEGAYKEAIQKLEAAVKLENRAAYFYNELGVLHTRLTLSEKAVAYYEKAIELAPEWGLPYINYSIEMFYDKKQDKAIEYGNKALALMPDYPQLYNLMGWIHANFWNHANRDLFERKGVELKEDFFYGTHYNSTLTERKSSLKNTISLLEKAIQLDSNYTAAHYNLGRVYRQVNANKKAIRHLKKAIALDPTNAKAYTKLASALRSQKLWPESVANSKKAIDLILGNESKANVHNSLGNTYINWDKPQKALEHYEKALDLYPSSRAPHANLSDIYRNRNNYQKAEWHRLKGLNSSNASRLRHAGDFYEEINRFQDAEWMYLKAVQTAPDYQNGYGHLMNLYQMMGKNDQALIWKQKLLTLGPNDPTALFLVGRFEYKNKQYDEAEKHFQKMIALNPKSYDYHNNIGWFYYIHNETSKAERYLKTAIGIKTKTLYAHQNLAWLYQEQNELKKAEKVIEKALALDPNSEYTHYYKVVLYLLTKEKEKASEAFSKLIELFPKYTFFKDAIDAFENGNYESAASFFEQAMAMGEVSDYMHYFYSLVKIKQGKYKEALTLLYMVFEEHDKSFQFFNENPELEPIRQLPGYQLLMRQHFPEKYDDLDQFDYTSQEGLYYPESCLLLAKYYDNQQNLDRATELYRKAIELRPDTLSNSLAFYLAEAYLKLGQYEEAKLICPEAIESEEEDVLFNAGELLYQLGKEAAAKAHFEQYLQLTKIKNAKLRVGAFYRIHGDFDMAEPLFKEAIESVPDDMFSYWNLGFLYLVNNNKEAAYQTLQEAIKLQPGNLFNHYFFALLHYLDDPLESKMYYERAGFISHWNCLELMRSNQYEKADQAWKDLQINYPIYTWPNCKYFYAHMKIRQGETDLALQLLDEIFAEGIINYQGIENDTELDPVRETEKFKAMMRKYFPEKMNK